MSNDTITEYTFEITNGCTCNYYDEDTNEYIECTDCWGDCWDMAVEDFANITEVLRNSNETNWWKVSDIRLWDRTVSGYFYAENIKDIIRGMSVDSEWIMRGTAYADRVEYSLSHHDAMGSATTLTAVTEEQREELGLY